MELGPIHLIAEPPNSYESSVMYCGATEVIAAIHPDRVPDFGWDMICPTCLESYRQSSVKIS
jgi:hypothetical protein